MAPLRPIFCTTMGKVEMEVKFFLETAFRFGFRVKACCRILFCGNYLGEIVYVRKSG